MISFKRAAAVTLVAAGLTVVLGVAPASATVGCKTNTSPCSSIYGTGTPVELSLKTGSTAVFEFGVATIKCSKSSLKGEAANAGGSAFTWWWDVTNTSFSECGSCTLSVAGPPRFIAHWKAFTLLANYTIEKIEATATCGGTKCVYGTMVSEKVTGEGGEMAVLKFEGTPIAKKEGSFLCTAAKFTAEYTVNAPAPLYYEEA